jgi:hypothetical protein
MKKRSELASSALPHCGLDTAQGTGRFGWLHYFRSPSLPYDGRPETSSSPLKNVESSELVPLVEAIENNLGRKPEQASADSGYCSEPNLKDCASPYTSTAMRQPRST